MFREGLRTGPYTGDIRILTADSRIRFSAALFGFQAPRLFVLLSLLTSLLFFTLLKSRS